MEHAKLGFTTSATDLPHLEHVQLSDSKALAIHKVSSKTKHTLVHPPDPDGNGDDKQGSLPTEAWEAFYPKGSINPSGAIPGGFSFYLSGTPAFINALENGAKHVTFSYRFLLQHDWEWVKGGKLPGVFGGVGDLAYHCTGGRAETRTHCFDLRPMWRPNGVGELYVYLPVTPSNTRRLLAVPPKSYPHASNYGVSVGRGAFHFKLGYWTTITQRIKLNDMGQENGEIHLYINKELVISCTGLTLRTSPESRFKGMHFQTFFGGHTPDWACPKDLRAWFADVSGAIID
ncbi:hypothetical protein AX17_004262 [Amanita inopinata Kibby_2008]|nr:hypothetical protein AX17_004262 [Amanita inopinata Kibby_2008]